MRGVGMVAEDEVGGSGQEHGRKEIIAGDRNFHIGNAESGKNQHCDDFLEHFKLGEVEILAANAVSGDLKTIFQKGDRPAHQNRSPNGSSFQIFEVPIPGKDHENIGNEQQENGFEHFRTGLAKRRVGSARLMARSPIPGERAGTSQSMRAKS